MFSYKLLFNKEKIFIVSYLYRAHFPYFIRFKKKSKTKNGHGHTHLLRHNVNDYKLS